MKSKKIILLIWLISLLWACTHNISQNKDTNTTKDTNVSANNSTKNINKSFEKQTITTNKNFTQVSVSEFKKEMKDNNVVVIDVRTTPELKQSWVIPWAKQIDLYSSDFVNKLSSLDKNKKYLVYCRSGSRSYQAISLMKKLWFKNVLWLQGGMNVWLNSWEKTVPFDQ